MMVDYVISVLAIAVSVTGVAFFAGSETAFVSSDRFRMRGMARRGVTGAAAASRLLEHPAILLSATLIGTNVFVVLTSSIATTLLSRTLGPYAVLASTGVVTVVILLFGEIIPKAIARSSPEVFLAKVGPGLYFAYYVLFPLAKAASMMSSLLLRLRLSKERRSAVTRDGIRALVKEAAQTGFGDAGSPYAHRVLDLARMKVTSIMLPMDEVFCLDEESTIDDALVIASRSGHSRYPVYKRTPENLVGILYVKDLLAVPGSSKVKIFARSAYFIPETKSVKEAILEMRSEVRHLGIVTDEYGRSLGIVTFEDLVEEIMGEISDEYDRVKGTQLELGRIVSGSTPISLLNEELGMDIPEGPYDTVAGFILDHSGSIPKAGSVIQHDGFLFHIVEIKGRRIRRIRITRQGK